MNQYGSRRLACQSPLAILVLCASLLAVSSCWSTSSVRVATTRGSGQTLVIGSMEYRDLRFLPYTLHNFRNMLEFELISRGYNVSIVEAKPARTTHAPKGKDRKVKTDDLMPTKFRSVAGETPPIDIGPTGQRSVRLNESEIRTLAKRSPFRYFLQGAIGSSESGSLLEIEENVLVFLTVHDDSGRQVGAITYTVAGRSFENAEFLQLLCSRIATAFHERITGQGRPSTGIIDRIKAVFGG